MTTSYNSTTRYGSGTFNQTKTLTLPRQRGSERSKVPAPYGANSFSLPGGKLIGEDWASTVLKFTPNIPDCLINTENFNTDIAGIAWNDNNTEGDPDLRASLCYVFENFAVDGSAEIRNYAYGDIGHPDPHGTDFVRTADGLCVQGNGCLAKYLRFFQIPGIAVLIKQGVGGQSGSFGIYDDIPNYLENIVITQALYGITVLSGDSRLSHCTVGGIIKDAVTMGTSGGQAFDVHVSGADRGMVWTQGGKGLELYSEAARIGTHIEASGGSTRITGLDFGPGTCYGRGLLIEAYGCKVTNLFGTVSAPLVDHPDIAGFEIGSGILHTLVQGQMTVLGTSKGGIIRGLRNKFDLMGDVGSTGAGKFLSVEEAIQTTHIIARGTCYSGSTVLDLSTSNLHTVNGLGNVFEINCNSGGGTEVALPAGKTYADLVGTKIYIRGDLQT